MKRFSLADQYDDVDSGWVVEANTWEEALDIAKAEEYDVLMWVEIDEYCKWIGDIEYT
tara:strand:+ start:690 stop:863 length:174 start_codon:yes stop_codon:yes gene_type:complete